MDFRPVIYYTHEGSDGNHYTVDTVAIVLKQVDDYTADLVIFPVGGPTRYERVSAWNEDAPLPPAGGSYWREQNSDPPDFTKAYRHYNNPETHALIAKQQAALAKAPPAEREALIAEQDKEWDALMAKLDGNEPKAEPEPVQKQYNTDEADLDRRA